MTKRERNLLILMAVAVLAAGIFVLVDRFPAFNGSSVSGPAVSLEDVNKLVDDIEKSRKESAPDEVESLIVSAAARPWKADGFYEGSLQFGPKAREKGIPSYTGYIELGSEKLAILNGIEYMAGDLIEGGRYRVVDIEPDHVVLAGEQGEVGMSLPYEDPGDPGR